MNIYVPRANKSVRPRQLRGLRGEWSFVIRMYYNNSDNDIALGETGVGQTCEQSWVVARAQRTPPDLQTSTTELRLAYRLGELSKLFLNESLIILLFNVKAESDKSARRSQH